MVYPHFKVLKAYKIILIIYCSKVTSSVSTGLSFDPKEKKSANFDKAIVWEARGTLSEQLKRSAGVLFSFYRGLVYFKLYSGGGNTIILFSIRDFSISCP